MIIQTEQQLRSTIKALTETCALVDKFQGNVDRRDALNIPDPESKKLLQVYKAHAEKLSAMIDQYKPA